MNKRRTSGGYTLIELMVSVGLFAIVMTLAAGAYLTIINLTRSAQAVSTAVDSISFSLEYMTREIRTGTAYGCGEAAGTDCPGGGSTFTFTDQSGHQVTFSLQNAAIYQGSASITDSTVTISSLQFYVVGTKPVSDGDYIPPHVTILVSGSVSTGKTSVPFTIETGATMRGVDL